MAVVDLTTAYIHRGNDLADFVAFNESRTYDNRGAESTVTDQADGSRRIQRSPRRNESITVEAVFTTRDIVEELLRFRDELVLFRSPTGDYHWDLLKQVRKRRTAQQGDHLVRYASIVLIPVDGPTLL